MLLCVISHVCLQNQKAIIAALVNVVWGLKARQSLQKNGPIICDSNKIHEG